MKLKLERLSSYQYVLPGQIQHEIWEEVILKTNDVKIFLDSGAFSASTQGITIDVQEYIGFIKKYENKLEVYANLDVIGDAEKSWQNQEKMEKAGLSPLPVYHVEDDLKYLYKCLDYPYFCLGGMARGYTTGERTKFLDMCFKIICDTLDNLPRSKLHGFGMTSFDLMLRYPWYSVDSTSWIITGRNGGVYVPSYRDGGFIYSVPPNKIVVSNRSPDSAVDPDHISCLSPRTREVVEKYFSMKGYDLGETEWKDVPLDYQLRDGERWTKKKSERERDGKGRVEVMIQSGLSNDYRKRDELNIIYFADLEKSMPEWPWPFKLKKKRGFVF